MKRKSGSPASGALGIKRAWAHSRRRRRSFQVTICCAILLLLTGVAAAKKKKPLTKTIQGEVVDQDNNPIAGASVELTDVTTGKTLGIYSEASGRFHFADLKPTDDYQVHAAYKGQRSDDRHVSSLDDEAVRELNLTIPPAASQ